MLERDALLMLNCASHVFALLLHAFVCGCVRSVLCSQCVTIWSLNLMLPSCPAILSFFAARPRRASTKHPPTLDPYHCIKRGRSTASFLDDPEKLPRPESPLRFTLLPATPDPSPLLLRSAQSSRRGKV